MPGIHRRWRTLLFCLLILCCGYAQAVERIRIATGEWPPYFSQDLPHYGLASRIVTEAFDLVGVAVEYQFFPWNRSLEATRSGHLEATVGWSDIEERKKDFLFSAEPIIVERTVFFHSLNKPVKPGEVWLSRPGNKLLVGVTLGYEYGEEFTLAERNGVFEVYRNTSDEANFRLLLNNRIDLFPMDRVVGVYMLNKHFSEQERATIAAHPKVFRETNLYLLFSAKSPRSKELNELFDRGMRMLRVSGKLEVLERMTGTESLETP